MNAYAFHERNAHIANDVTLWKGIIPLLIQLETIQVGVIGMN